MHIDDIIREKAAEDGQFAIAYAIQQLAHQLYRLGIGSASTDVGALEYVGGQVGKVADALNKVSLSMGEVATVRPPDESGA
ncbi:hypothetical protein [Methylobacterium nonmethylotrophicum]|uniref:Uncharacterized protein n=1 Tax=Methylobacterium nonmethylotrophicum TaxID=1141884 RepID=A0A4Z0NNQ9_9HYPH|nr:hypothetical protein [Methylobacterium nonmethylotrophicum]TGD97654.1 hypothetical protein EU555_18625 [Methylobacterium nonmethylotrophicum]